MANQATDTKTAKPSLPLYNQGEVPQVVNAVVGVEAAWNDADTVILAYNVPVGAKVLRIMLPAGSPAITGASDYDIGCYKPADADGQGLGAALDADALVDGISFVSARSSAVDILGTNIGSFDKTKTLGELLGLTSETAPSGVHIVMTLNTAGTAAGDIDIDIHLAMAH